LAYTVVAGPAVEAPYHELFADGGLEAARWVADHSDPYDVVATNVHCASPFAAKCDNRNFWVAAFTERRVVIEGWGYTQPTRDDTSEGTSATHTAPPDPERLRINDEAFRRPSAATVGQLVDTYDVKFLFVDKQYPVRLRALKQLSGVVRRVFHNENYAVFKVVSRGG
jgi:hypothetical protein